MCSPRGQGNTPTCESRPRGDVDCHPSRSENGETEAGQAAGGDMPRSIRKGKV